MNLVPNFTCVELYLHFCMHRHTVSSVVLKYRTVMQWTIK